MNEFYIPPNAYLRRKTRAFYHSKYTRYRNRGNPDYINVLKNTYNSCSAYALQSAAEELKSVLHGCFYKLANVIRCDGMMVCVVPRAKSEESYHPKQLEFRSVVREVVRGWGKSFVDGTDCMIRHTNTRTTHLPKSIQNFVNDGPDPYPGITEDTCYISHEVRGKTVLLIDDVYTPGVNVNEDAISALYNAGADSVTLYAVSHSYRDWL